MAHKPPKAALKAFRNGQKAQESGKFAEAAEFYEQALEADGNWFEARVNLGVQYYRLGLAERAVSQLERAIEIDPSSAVAFSNLGAAYVQLDMWDAAERAARQAVELDPFLSAGRYVLGVTLWNLGRTGEAVNELRRAATDFDPARELLARLRLPAPGAH
jgi:tetratricopeptide (TPR) repeat protein